MPLASPLDHSRCCGADTCRSVHHLLLDKMRTITITAPSIVKALRAIGVSNSFELLAMPENVQRDKLKAYGANDYVRTRIRRLRGWAGRNSPFEVGLLDGEKYAIEANITLRDRFAGLAMQGHYHAAYAYDGPREARDTEPSPLTLQCIAEASYKMADAMLKAREQ